MLYYYSTDQLEAGCDEAGRGCLAGPVFAAAVIWPKNLKHPKLNDSKKLSKKDRTELRSFIEQHAIAYSVKSVSEQEIDQINILNASIRAMHLAIEDLDVHPNLLLIDGNRFNPFNDIPYHCIVKGDSKYASIAAASILAKTYRDEYMQQLGLQYPQYQWEQNKGYATLAHRVALLKEGPTEYHRKSFTVRNQPSLFNND